MSKAEINTSLKNARKALAALEAARFGSEGEARQLLVAASIKLEQAIRALESETPA